MQLYPTWIYHSKCFTGFNRKRKLHANTYISDVIYATVYVIISDVIYATAYVIISDVIYATVYKWHLQTIEHR